MGKQTLHVLTDDGQDHLFKNAEDATWSLRDGRLEWSKDGNLRIVRHVYGLFMEHEGSAK